VAETFTFALEGVEGTSMNSKGNKFDVIVVGAGAAGVGMGVVLRHLGVTNFTLVDRYEVGASFLRWPKEMRFISPSFASNGFGLMDLNAVAVSTSPAYTLHREHPNGAEYAHYLKGVARYFELPVQEGVDVQRVRKEGRTFRLQTATGELRSRFLIWAGGEFQYPNTQPFPGAEHCTHSATVRTWQTFPGAEVAVIGGYESGIDAAVSLARLGKQVQVFDERTPWAVQTTDPSLSLSPYTQLRLQKAIESGRLTLIPTGVRSVEKNGNGYLIHTGNGETHHAPSQPILATGFTGSLSLVRELFDWHEAERYALLTAEDESLSGRPGRTPCRVDLLLYLQISPTFCRGRQCHWSTAASGYERLGRIPSTPDVSR
jgi:putative flavoprotein involved in K+ transport